MDDWKSGKYPPRWRRFLLLIPFLIGIVLIVVAWTPSVFNMEPRSLERSYAKASQGIWQHTCKINQALINSDMSITVTFKLMKTDSECSYQWNQRIVPIYISKFYNQTYSPCWSSQGDPCSRPLSIIQNIEDTSGYISHGVGQFIIGITGFITLLVYLALGIMFCIVRFV